MRQNITQQPQALRDLVAAYARGALSALGALPAGPPVLTGMGASLHAAQIAAAHMQALGLPAIAVESVELLYYGRALLAGGRPLVFISQSGASPEVAPILSALPPGQPLLAVTNTADSPLARGATAVLPIHAGPEKGVATRTYVNTLAALWLLSRHWAGAVRGDEAALLGRVAARIDALLAEGAAAESRWMAALGVAATPVFLGHGPHAATARQAAMMLAERARIAAVAASVGAFRHGPIEIVEPGSGVAIFAAPGATHASACALAAELDGYGARVLIVEQGRARGVAEPALTDEPEDEFLGPILDVIPAQLFADALATARGLAPGFRYLGDAIRQV